MPEKQLTQSRWFTYRPKWLLRKRIDSLLVVANTKFAQALKEFDSAQETVDNLVAHGHKATANGYCDARTQFIGEHNNLIAYITRKYKKATKTRLYTILDELNEHCTALANAKPLSGWDPSPRHELALRAEIGIKVRRIYTLADDINHMMPSKLGPNVAAHDFDLLEDFVEIMRLCSALPHEPRIKHFTELNAFMSRLLALDTRMHELKRILREHH